MEEKNPENELICQRKCKWMNYNVEWHQEKQNELRLLDLRDT